jgi:hypothetical protein
MPAKTVGSHALTKNIGPAAMSLKELVHDQTTSEPPTGLGHHRPRRWTRASAVIFTFINGPRPG